MRVLFVLMAWLPLLAHAEVNRSPAVLEIPADQLAGENKAIYENFFELIDDLIMTSAELDQELVSEADIEN